MFYARIKGKDAAAVESEISAMIADLGLPHKRDEVAKNLSGGMQRKLSIASAFVGGSRYLSVCPFAFCVALSKFPSPKTSLLI